MRPSSSLSSLSHCLVAAVAVPNFVIIAAIVVVVERIRPSSSLSSSSLSHRLVVAVAVPEVIVIVAIVASSPLAEQFEMRRLNPRRRSDDDDDVVIPS